ncbi:unnamed protein product [Kuraishia capsulata CBS 1993]|uniref:Uncharacterized protein n=1 Tax=Kuraishia capsulata CBS 1993 TaxID=1382522 RepID=W6MXX1_9ASCO|nr:uncharacterized protein KUCA_T00005618001 [Kuraishia capsulata CBS 1993]CDK29625.1 unnamed protein product [Kuraishia capsulata CBS 1993]
MVGYDILCCGSNGNYQLGTGTSEDSAVLQNAVMRGVDRLTTKPTSIRCGGNHTLMLVELGDVFVAGDNSKGQCGLNPQIDGQNCLSQFTKLPRLNGKRWTHISAGWDFSVLINENHEVYACGEGLNGELGLGELVTSTLSKSEEDKFTLLRINLDVGSGVRSIKSSIHHTVILLKSGVLLGWGNNKKGQLTPVSLSKLVWSPQTIEVDGNRVIGFNVCRDFTCIELASGRRRFRILGKNAEELEEEAHQMFQGLTENGYDSFTVHNMWTSLHLFGSNGENATVSSMGNNSHSQRLESLPDQLQKDAMVCSLGSEHGLFLTMSNKVYAWGWGEHGNCGVQKEEGTVFATPNEIYDGRAGRVVLIQGGCATSWVVTQN